MVRNIFRSQKRSGMIDLLLYSDAATVSCLKTVIYGIFLLSFSIGCSTKMATENELIEYVREVDNGLIKTTKRGDIEVSAVYRPLDLIVAQELGNNLPDEKQIEQVREKYRQNAYFVLSVSNDNKDALYSTANSYSHFSENLQKLSFRMPEYLFMTTSARDTVELLDFNYSRMHGMGASTQVLLAFDKDKLQDKEWVQLNLKEMGFGVGRVNLRFKGKDIEKTPQIDFLTTRTKF